MYIDAHNHLKNWSPDADQSLEELLNNAKKNGLYGIGISDHYDLGSLDSYGSEWIFDIKKYFNTHSTLRRSIEKRKVSDDPGLLIGIEVGYRQSYEEEIQEVLTSGPYDNIILSIHMIDEYDPYHHQEEVYGRPQKELYSYFLKLLLRSVKRFPEVTTMGHFDYICRYSPDREVKVCYHDYPDEFDELFRTLIKHEIALEVNTGTVSALMNKGYDLAGAMPDSNVLRRYKELGGELITLTVDSHRPSHHMRYIPETLEYLRSLDIKRLCYFEEMKPLWYEI